MKHFTRLFFTLLFLMEMPAFAQVLGDFRTKSSGDWGSFTVWQVYNGSFWVDATVGQIPGGSSEIDAKTIYIEAGHTITLSADQSCKDLHLNTTADVVRINTQNSILNVWGKMRFYEGVAPGTSTPSSVFSSGVVGWISTGTAGAIRFKGTADRVIMADGQVNSNNTNSGWNLDFAFDPGFTGEIQERLRASNITVSSGTLYVSDPTGELRVGTNNGGSDITPNGDFLVKSGATLRGGAGIFKKSNVAAASFTVEAGGNLIVTQNNFILAAQSVNLLGTVTLENAINFPAITGREGTAVPINTFNNLVFSGAGVKTMVNSITINGSLTLKDQTSLNVGGYTLAYGSSGELIYNGSIAQTTGNEFPASNSPAKLTINNTNGVTLSASRTITSELTLNSGQFYLGNHDLTLGASVSQVMGTPSIANMVVTNGTGKLNKIFNSTGSFVFPIGDTTGIDEYSPGNVMINSASALNGSTYFGVRVIDTLHASTVATTDNLSRYWEVVTNMTSYSYSGSFAYSSQDVYGNESNLVSFLFADETAGSHRKALAAVNATLHQIDFTNQNEVGFIGGSNFGCSITNNSISPASSVCQGLQVPINGTAAVVTSGSPVYQWQVSKNGGAWFDAGTQEDYTLADTTGFGQYSLRRVVSDPSNCSPSSNVTSNTISVTIYQITSIISQPSNVSTCSNVDVNFYVTALGSNNSYQWQVSQDNGSNYTDLTITSKYKGVNTSNLKIVNAPVVFNNYKYRCVVSGICSSITSNDATLIVNSTQITSQPNSQTICDETSTVFSLAASGPGLIYQWELSTNGGNTYSLISNGGNYNNVSTSSLSVNGVDPSMDNYKYRCSITGTCGASFYSYAATLRVLPKSIVTLNPTDVSTCPNTNVAFNATGTGTNVFYQWQVSSNGGVTFLNISNSSIYSNVTSETLGINAAPQSFNGNQYRLRVSGSCGTAFSNAAVLNLNSPQITSQPGSKTICDGTSTIFDFTASGPGLIYQWEVSTNGGLDYTAISDGGNYSNVNTSTLSVNSVDPLMDTYRYRCLVSSTCGAFVYSYGATLRVLPKSVVTLNPTDVSSCPNSSVAFTGTGTGTNIFYQWQVSSDGGITFLNISNSSIYSNVTSETLGITAAPQSFNGNQYRLRVSGSCSVEYSSAAVLNLNSPQITSQPGSKTICDGTSTLFSFTASGPGLMYQWQLSTNGGSTYSSISNGGNYNNVTTSALSVNNVNPSMDAYRYRCIVSSTCGAFVYSYGATLRVLASSVVTANPSNVTTNANSNVNFTAGGTGTNIYYLWQVSKDGGLTFTNLSNGAIYNNVTTNSLSIISVPASYNNYFYRLRISGSCSVVFTTAAQLTLNSPRISLEENEHTYQVYTFPNPFNEEVKIQTFGFEDEVSVVVRNLEGKVVHLSQMYNAEINIGRDLPNGIYIIEVMDANHKEVQKVVKSE